MKKRVLLGMSGGGDSAVTAVLLKNQGYQVLGCYLKVSDPLPQEDGYWEKEALERKKRNGVKRPAADDEDSEAPRKAQFRSHCSEGPQATEVSAICARFDIPFYEMDVRAEFEAAVVDPLIHAVLQRRSIYTCHACNIEIKIQSLFKKADELGCDLVATGHYAQIVHESASNRYLLKKAVDSSKDQTFDLSGLSQGQLSRLLMPLGGLSQGMVRKLAQEFGFEFRIRKSGIGCFLKSPELIPFLEQHTSPSLRPAGVIRTVDGDVVGDHDGLYQFQIGQTDNLSLSMQDGKRKVMVVGFEPTTNVLVVGDRKDLEVKEVLLSSVNWLEPMDGLGEIRAQMRVQDLAESFPVRVYCFENRTAHVYLDSVADCFATGMRAVLMDGDRVIGGGTVERVESR